MKKIFISLGVLVTCVASILAVNSGSKLADPFEANVEALAQTEGVVLQDCWMKRTGLGWSRTGIYCVTGTDESLAYGCPNVDLFVRGDKFKCYGK